MTDFDEVIDDLGEFGLFQIQLVLLVSMFEVVPTMCLFMPIFSEALPQWICPMLNATSNETGINMTLLTDMKFESEDLENIEKYAEALNITDYTIQMCHSDGGFCEGAIFLTSASSIRTEWQFCETSFLVSPITMFPVAGMFMGGFVFGHLGDTFGRKPIMFLAYILLLVTQGVMSFVHVWHLYMICRFFVGFSGVGVMLLNFVLPVEVVGKSWRVLCAVPLFGLFGCMLLALLAYLLPNWRLLSITCAAMGIPLLFTWWLIPESPRWHIQKGNTREADLIIQKIASCNGKEMPEFTKVDAAEVKQHCLLKYSCFDLFRGRPMVRNIIILMLIWFVSSISYNATLAKIGRFVQNPYLNFFLVQVSELPIFIVVAVFTDKVGRTKALSTLMMVAGLSCLVILLAQTLGILADMEWQVKGCALISKAMIAGAIVVARIMCSELFPTLVRCIGIGACKMAFEMGKLMVPLIVQLDNQSRPLPFIVLSCLSLCTAVISLCLPETNEGTMPDTLPPRKWCTCCCCCKADRGEDYDESWFRHRNDWTDSRCVDQGVPLHTMSGNENGDQHSTYRQSI